MTSAHCEGRETMLVAFDLLEHDGADLCALPLIERKKAAHDPDRFEDGNPS